MTVTLRYYLSGNHIDAAAYFTRLCYEFEQQFLRDGDLDRVFRTHRSCVLGSVILAVAFLEATINELFVDAASPVSTVFEGLTPERAGALRKSWQGEGSQRVEVLAKYHMAFDALGVTPMNNGAGVWQDVQALVDLRNALVHFEPVTQVTRSAQNPKERHSLESALKGRFLETPLFANTANPFYPDRCLGHGCAAWAVNRSQIFATEFFRLIDVRQHSGRDPLPTQTIVTTL